MPHPLSRLFALVSMGATLAACGGGGGASSTPAPPPPPASRGTLVGTSNPATLARSQIDAYDANQSQGPIRNGETAACDVTVRQVRYATILPAGGSVTASAGLLVPAGAGCSGARPLVAVAHGTSVSADFDGSDPTSQAVLLSAKYFAAHGYVVVIPDYLGYGASRAQITWHPYVQAEANAATVIDALRAVRHWFASTDGQASGVALDGAVMLTGTSEGGYIALATQRTLERDDAAEITLSADVPVSGPYDLTQEVLDDLAHADASGNSDTGSAAFLLTGYQATYGDIYAQPEEVFQAPWAADVEGLFPSTVYASASQAIQHCQIPVNLDTSPSPPPSCQPQPLLQAAFVADFDSGAQSTPGGTARAHIDANDLVNPPWTPVAPLVPCYGSLDATAAANAQAAAAALGVQGVDVQTAGPRFIQDWMQANRNAADYHGRVEAGGCTAYARYQVFDALVAPLR